MRNTYLTLLHFHKLFNFWLDIFSNLYVFPCSSILSVFFSLFLCVLSSFLGHSPFLISFLNICFSHVSFFLLSFLNVSLLFFFEDSLWFDYTFPAFFLLLHTLLSFQQPRFFTKSCLLSPFFEKSPFSFFLFFHFTRKNFVIENLLTHFETSDFELFTFTSTDSTFSLLECLLCLFIPSFCSSSIHLFSLLSRRVFSFLSLFAIFIFLFFLVLDRLFSFLFLFSSFHKNHDSFLLFPKKKHDFVWFLSCWTCFTIMFPALYCFSVSCEMVSRFCLNSPWLFSFSSFQHSVSHLLLSCFDETEKCCVFPTNWRRHLLFFPLSAIFLFFFFCALVCCVKVCVTNPFIFELFLEFLAHPFSLFTFFPRKKSAQKPSFFVSAQSLFCFTFAFNIFPYFLSSLFLSSFFLPFYLFIPFCFSHLFLFSPFSILSLFLYLSVSLSLFSLSHVYLSFFLHRLIFLLSLSFDLDLFVFLLLLTFFPSLFFPKKSKFSVVNFLKTKLCLYFLNPPVICVKSRVFLLLASSFFLVCSSFLLLRLFIVTFLWSSLLFLIFFYQSSFLGL